MADQGPGGQGGYTDLLQGVLPLAGIAASAVRPGAGAALLAVSQLLEQRREHALLQAERTARATERADTIAREQAGQESYASALAAQGLLPSKLDAKALGGIPISGQTGLVSAWGTEQARQRTQAELDRQTLVGGKLGGILAGMDTMDYGQVQAALTQLAGTGLLTKDHLVQLDVALKKNEDRRDNATAASAFEATVPRVTRTEAFGTTPEPTPPMAAPTLPPDFQASVEAALGNAPTQGPMAPVSYDTLMRPQPGKADIRDAIALMKQGKPPSTGALITQYGMPAERVPGGQEEAAKLAKAQAEAREAERKASGVADLSQEPLVRLQQAYQMYAAKGDTKGAAEIAARIVRLTQEGTSEDERNATAILEQRKRQTGQDYTQADVARQSFAQRRQLAIETGSGAVGAKAAEERKLPLAQVNLQGKIVWDRAQGRPADALNVSIDQASQSPNRNFVVVGEKQAEQLTSISEGKILLSQFIPLVKDLTNQPGANFAQAAELWARTKLGDDNPGVAFSALGGISLRFAKAMQGSAQALSDLDRKSVMGMVATPNDTVQSGMKRLATTYAIFSAMENAILGDPEATLRANMLLRSIGGDGSIGSGPPASALPPAAPAIVTTKIDPKTGKLVPAR